MGTTKASPAASISSGGSPPLAWGQLSVERSGRHGPRFTPTRVGTTHEVHEEVFGLGGSPPLAWGQLSYGSGLYSRLRFTPTRVGTTANKQLPAKSPAVHPHSRGDNTDHNGSMNIDDGSPPLAWGQRRYTHCHFGPTRFTPTRVGTTRNRSGQSWPKSVHPHSRGDNDRKIRMSFCFSGSPPLAWGQL